MHEENGAEKEAVTPRGAVRGALWHLSPCHTLFIFNREVMMVWEWPQENREMNE